MKRLPVFERVEEITTPVYDAVLPRISLRVMKRGSRWVLLTVTPEEKFFKYHKYLHNYRNKKTLIDIINKFIESSDYTIAELTAEIVRNWVTQ